MYIIELIIIEFIFLIMFIFLDVYTENKCNQIKKKTINNKYAKYKLYKLNDKKKV